MTVQVRYHLLWGVVFVALGAGNVVVYTQTTNLMFVALAGLMALMGLLYLVRPLLVIDDHAIQVRSLLGGVRRSFPIDGLHGLEVERDGIVIGHGERAKKLRLSAIFIRRSDLHGLAEQIRQARAAARPTV